MLKEDLQNAVEAALETPVIAAEAVGGGCIHSATRIETPRGMYFLKYNAVDQLSNFQAEMEGLQALGKAACLKVPNPIACGSSENHAFLIMDFVETGTAKPDYWEDFGQSLAAQHRITQDHYGYHRDNYIGRLPQYNARQESWISFFIENRLEKQLQLAESNRLASSRLRLGFEKLYKRLPELLPDAPASFLHGDLWSGNFMTGPQGNPVIVDPAVYYGHREAEIAFTRMFGGFNSDFYSAYNESWPMEPGWENRIPIFNLYPLTVHLNLFGRSYLPEIRFTLGKFDCAV